MVSVADSSYHMLSRHMGGSEEADFTLYADPTQNVYLQHQPYHGLPNFDLDNNGLYHFARAQAQAQANVPFTAASGFSSNTIYAEADASVSSYALESPELRAGASSNYSTASGASAASSAIGSPPSVQGHIASVPEWATSSLGPNHPNIVRFDSFSHNGNEYNFPPSGMEEFALEFDPAKPDDFVDPSILHPQYAGRPSSATQSSEVYHAQAYPESPALSNHSQLSRSPRPARQGSQSPYLNSHYAAYPYPPPRRQSIQSYSSQENFSSEESREKGRCTYSDCGKVFKDLKAHMLTHQNERPEKCPIQTCEYHIKGFARKYDKNRHTLTHYKGTMVCGFCPGSGSSHEKSFNRADVFKRHLTSVHAVEQTPPNSRKKTATNNGGRNLPGYVSETSGKCSTCSATFGSAQDFYEHLDDCVLRIVQQEEPSEAVNAARLAEVEQDADVHETLRNNALPTTTTKVYFGEEEDEDDDMDDDNDDDFSLTTKLPRKTRNNRATNGGIQKSRGLTHSKGGVTTVVAKGRKRRKDYPQSWGCAASQMKMKKRVLCVFDGPRRLWKDDMMIDTSGGETRVSLPDGKSYVTDLDVMTVRRADGFHNASEDEKGPWIADDLTGLDVEKLLEVKTEP